MATGGRPLLPPPPPPPPPTIVSHCPSTFMKSAGIPEPKIQSSLLCQRHFDNEDFYNECSHLLSYYHPVSPVLQEGPSCGLAALCMAAQLLDVKPELTLVDVLQAARKLGLTCRGEMFSAANMCVLAWELISIKADRLTDGLDQRDRIVRHLAGGKPILVPYDADLNHEPSCRHGHKAHWAVLTGAVFVIPSHMGLATKTSAVRDEMFPFLFHGENIDVLDQMPNGCRLYVYARQGKSCHPSLWSYDLLAKSNANLTELSPLRRRSIDGYVVPADGVEGGLCSQIVMLGTGSS